MRNQERMNLIVNIVKHSREELFASVLLHYISLNQDPKSFAEIYWVGKSGDIDPSDWKNILSIVEKSDLGIKLISIKRYMKDQC